MRLRVIDFGLVPGLRSQAVYHGLAETLGPDSDPILSLASPATPYVCVGMHQDIEKEVDTAFCAAHGLPVWRRQVGGGAVYLDHNQLFTHFIYPEAKAPSRADQLYPMFIEPVVRTYREMGINAVWRPVNDIQVDGRKIGGTGAASIGQATVMVGSFLLDFDTATMAKCLKVPSEKFRDKLRQTLDDYMTTMVKELGHLPDRADLKARFLRHCADALGVQPVADQPTRAEWVAIEQAEAMLSDPEWTDVQHRKTVALGVKIAADTHLTEAARKAPGGLVRVNLLAREGRVADLLISGDFTCLPPDGVDRLCDSLKGVALDEAALTAAATAAIARLGLDLPGVAAADLAATILAAAEGAP
ncbi:lipoyl protein ligase domain-containing protein [Rhodobacter ferrooxidans]|uniref:lipoate--protein ligase n=1 Tax=Rhodobacter ferrooxidans TaxID=371731 RepID=C8S5G4_9RHOB|nr:lipoate protein ligase C-terminal domain-containing protein [Rhodobacter sp. SW2]EEW23777.1 biotin/lipoate A/B protein ligase [Rhodobacter sp. SW2]